MSEHMLNHSRNAQQPAECERRSITFAGRIRRSLASSKLAMFLLVVILGCCLVGVTVFRGEKAGQLIFRTIWFNSLLILMVANVAFCFFGRIWRKKITVVSLGMILFHLSFVAMFLGIVYNSLFYFNGILRLTEGETLPNYREESYDKVALGPLFRYSMLRGNTTLVRMHNNYEVDGKNKRRAYEIAVNDGITEKQGIIYITNSLTFKGLNFFTEKEGYSPLLVLSEKTGNEIYGGYIPIQSLLQKDGSYLYTSGTKEGPQSLMFPQEPLKPLYAIYLRYLPDMKKERDGKVQFSVLPASAAAVPHDEANVVNGTVPVGAKLTAFDHALSVKEVRYWVGMMVRYEPGKPIVMFSLWIGLFGMIITTVGRMTARQNPGVVPLEDEKGSVYIST